MATLSKSPLKLLRLAAGGTLIGWAAQHLFWEVPYRSLLWSENWVRAIVPNLSGSAWNDYVTNPQVESSVQNGMHLLGIVLLTIGVAALGMRRVRAGQAVCAQRWLVPTTVLLGSISFLIFKDSGFRAGILLEYSAQVISPLLLYWALTRASAEKLSRTLRFAIAFTFMGHGLFAIGYYPTPGAFIDMTINLLGVGEPQAIAFLRLAGVLDFAIALAIFHPRWWRPALMYAVAWGFFTTLARPVATLIVNHGTAELPYWTFQAIQRLPHFLLPLALYRLNSARRALRLTQGISGIPEYYKSGHSQPASIPVRR